MTTKTQTQHIKIPLDGELTNMQYVGSDVVSKWNPYEYNILEPMEDATITGLESNLTPISSTYAHYSDWLFGVIDNDTRILNGGNLLTDSNTILTDTKVVDTTYYQENILVACDDNKIYYFDPVNEEYSDTQSPIDVGESIRKLLYNEIDDRVYVITKYKIKILDGTNLTDGITYSTLDNETIRTAAIFKNYVIIGGYSYETGKYKILFWDRDTSSTTWSKEFVFDNYIYFIGEFNSVLYIVEAEYIHTSNKKYRRDYILKYFNGGNFIEQQKYRMDDDYIYITSFKKGGRFIVGAMETEFFNQTQETTDKTGFLFFEPERKKSWQILNLGFENLATIDSFVLGSNYSGAGNGLPVFYVTTYERNSDPTRQNYKITFDSDKFDSKSIYVTRFLGDNYNLKELTEFYVTYPRLKDGMLLKVYYRISDLDDWTELASINTDNISSKTDVNGDLFRKQIKNKLPKFQKIQFKFESTGGTAIISAGIFIKQHNYEG